MDSDKYTQEDALAFAKEANQDLKALQESTALWEGEIPVLIIEFAFGTKTQLENFFEEKGGRWSRMQLCDQGANAVAEFLKFNTTVTTVYLGGNQIGDEGAKAIAESLKVNTTVTEVILGGNQIGDEGAKAIAESLKVNTTVTRVYLSGNQIDTVQCEDHRVVF